jgi:hypothetical protein
VASAGFAASRLPRSGLPLNGKDPPMPVIGTFSAVKDGYAGNGERRNLLRNGSASDGPISRPRISRRPPGGAQDLGGPASGLHGRQRSRAPGSAAGAAHEARAGAVRWSAGCGAPSVNAGIGMYGVMRTCYAVPFNGGTPCALQSLYARSFSVPARTHNRRVRPAI